MKNGHSQNGSRGVRRPPFDAHVVEARDADLTTNQGVPIADDQNSLRAGERGPTLLEDFIMREKITHFDHERIPERVVHARGTGAHGYFQVYESMANLTRAAFLQDPAVKTPVFVRFSTVGGSRGSADTARDVRGFAVKFYTSEGNYDLVGNNMPVFFIQDAIKFPDFVHAVKPEPHNEIPQASSAHDTFYDFCSLVPESTHMVMWLMSDRAIPRSLRMMEGFGVHTFRLINAGGQAKYVKFHWKPLLGVHSLVWDEAQKLAGKDADFHRRDLWDAIDAGNFPEWEFGVQVFDDEQADAFAFDILDPTKLIPEELVPVQRIGKLVLDRNPDSFFAETEQAAFCAAHVVPGIDFTNDPLLQGRLFSYLDTQLTRLGGPNFHQIPINQPQCPFQNNQRDGLHQMDVNRGRASYEPASFDDGGPKEKKPQRGGFVSFGERIEGDKRRVRAESFGDHYSQATMFWNSMSPVEKEHIVAAFSFELAKVETTAIRERFVTTNLANVDASLAAAVATNLGMTLAAAPKKRKGHNGASAASPALSQMREGQGSAATRKVAILAAEGVNAADVAAMKAALTAAGAIAEVIAPRLGTLGGAVKVDHTLVTAPSVVYDAVYVPGGAQSIRTLSDDGDAVHFVAEAFKHAKPIAASGDAAPVLERAGFYGDGAREGNPEQTGLIVGKSGEGAAKLAPALIGALALHRAWMRAGKDAVPA
ncbi:MAG: catalase HPII [Candidatus Velthaea sp.]